jgi:hypothetical protein
LVGCKLAGLRKTAHAARDCKADAPLVVGAFGPSHGTGELFGHALETGTDALAVQRDGVEAEVFQTDGHEAAVAWDAKQFWQKDIKNATTCGVCYEHARLLQEQKILDIAVKSCADNVMSICKSSRLAHVPDPSFWLKILGQHEEKSFDFSCHISSLIAEFAQQNTDDDLSDQHACSFKNKQNALKTPI